MAFQYEFIPHIPEFTEYFHVGPLTIGVESRMLTDATTAAIKEGQGKIDLETISKLMAEYSQGSQQLKDGGVSLHVFGEADGGLVEYLRFDCFLEFPHYHYGYVGRQPSDQLPIDTVADGDALAWTVERLRTRLQPMLEHAGAHELASSVDQAEVEAVLPQVVRAAEKSLGQWVAVS